MDPDANLIEQRSVSRDILRIVDACSPEGDFTKQQLDTLAYEANRLAELVQALDGWIRGGGFLPAGWRKAS